MSFQRLAALMENEEYQTALAIVKALPANTRDMRVLGGKINKIEANILLASTLGSPADFKRLLRNRIIDNKLQPTLDSSTASPSSGLADDHISVGSCAKAITPHAAAALKSIGIGCLDISGKVAWTSAATRGLSRCLPRSSARLLVCCTWNAMDARRSPRFLRVWRRKEGKGP